VVCRYDLVRRWALRNAHFRRQLSSPDETPDERSHVLEDDVVGSDSGSEESDVAAPLPKVKPQAKAAAKPPAPTTHQVELSGSDSSDDSDASIDVSSDDEPLPLPLPSRGTVGDRLQAVLPKSAPTPVPASLADEEEEAVGAGDGDDFFVAMDDEGGGAAGNLPEFQEEIIDSSDDDMPYNRQRRGGQLSDGAEYRRKLGASSRQQRQEMFVHKRYKSADWHGERKSRYDKSKPDSHKGDRKTSGGSQSLPSAPKDVKNGSRKPPSSHFRFE
jgi:hypothetical protein